jgi:predicted dehydrogenase
MEAMVMKFLVIGLGSMGKRRIRNLKTLGFSDIIGFDVKQERRKEAEKLYGIRTIGDVDHVNDFNSVIISSPPDRHDEYLRFSLEKNKPCFMELNLILGDMPKLNEIAKSKKVLVAPSCTLKFHPSIQTIKKIVQSGNYGKLTNFAYHVGQYLPDWHPWENIKDFFVSKRETSGCKEILAVELHWLMDTFGKPKDILSCHEKSSLFDVNIDDTYAIILRFENFIGSLLIDVVSRFGTRALTLNLEKAQIRWVGEEPVVKLYDPETKHWSPYPMTQTHSEAALNPIEQMYVEEIQSFIEALGGGPPFPNTLDEDIELLNILERAEHSL